MAGEKNAGSIVYEISADVEPLLQGGKQAIDALDKLDAAAQQSGKGMDNLDQSTSQTGSAFTELAGYANSMDKPAAQAEHQRERHCPCNGRGP
ncbi:hypothetical protein [Enterobacter hormaechei]|uniref:hypothetical protein n=1 Tax=Enterobacter hormaechei TaxID=158836 RepID=UPI0040555050